MVARYIPAIIVIFVALAAYRLLGVSELFVEFIKPKHLQPTYDYIIGILFLLLTAILDNTIYRVANIYMYCNSA